MNDHPIEKPRLATFPATKPTAPTTTNTTPMIEPTTENYKTTTEKSKNLTTIFPIPNPTIENNNNTTSQASSPQTLDTPQKQTNHPTRRFVIPPAPTKDTLNIKAPHDHGSTTKPNHPEAPTALPVKSPMRTTPFTTPVPQPLAIVRTATPVRDRSPQTHRSGQILPAPAGTQGLSTSPTPTPTPTPTPIQYYKDPQ